MTRPSRSRDAPDVQGSGANTSQDGLPEDEPTTPVPEAEGGGERLERVARAICLRAELGAGPYTARDRRWVDDHWADWVPEARAAISALSSEAPPVVCGGGDGSARADVAEPGSQERAAVVPAAEQAGGLIARLRAVPRGVSEYGCQNCDEYLKAEAADALEAIAAAVEAMRRPLDALLSETAEANHSRAFRTTGWAHGMVFKVAEAWRALAAPPPDHDAIPSAEGGSAQSQPLADAGSPRSHDNHSFDGEG